MSSVQPTFLFDNQKRFDAQCEHDRSRSLLLSDIEAPPNTDPWKQRPVDFTMKNFHPKRKKDGKQSLQQNESPRERRSQSTENFDPRVMEPFLNQYKNANDPSSIGNDDDEDFDLDTRIQYERVKRMLNTEPYKNPKPHDYRQYPDLKELGLPEFSASYQRDPYNIRFHSQRLNMLWLQEREGEGTHSIQPVIPEMYRPMSKRPNWESRLILPKLVFPNKYAAYTRYRNPTRTIQSAYWERVEDQLENEKRKAVEKKRLAAF